MLFYQFIRTKRAPWIALAVLLFAAFLSGVLCQLQEKRLQQIDDYSRVETETPIHLIVTDLTGTKNERLNAPYWAAEVFLGGFAIPHELKNYVKDVEISAYRLADAVFADGQLCGEMVELCGVSSQSQLPIPAGESMRWLEGYDAGVLLTSERVCVLPEYLAESGLPEVVVLNFEYDKQYTTLQGTTTVKFVYELELEVVGTCPGETIYCPLDVVFGVFRSTGSTIAIHSIRAVLADNRKLEEAKEHIRYWFVEPDLDATKVPWDYSYYSYYPYALRIDDSQLQTAKAAIENSILVSRLSTVFVFVLSAAAGGLIGFMTIRSRKREIALLQILGISRRAVVGVLFLEQLICVLAGTAIGGVVWRWQPLGQLAGFAGVYLFGLAVALGVILRMNLLLSVKEEG